MKLRIVIALLVFFTATFASIHQVEHIVHNDADVCFVCTVSDNFQAADVVEADYDFEIICCKKKQQTPILVRVSFLKLQYPARAPPLIS